MSKENLNENTSGAANPKKVEKIEKVYSDAEIVMRSDAAEKKRNAVLFSLPVRIFMAIWDYAWNPGGRKVGDHLSLYNEITTIGMNTKPVISSRITLKELVELLKDKKNDKSVIKALKGLCGHLRSVCVSQAEIENPEAFKKFWANGVDVEIVQSLDPNQELYLAEDHDTVSRDKETVIRQAVGMFQRSCTARDVTLKLWDELSIHFSPISGDNKAKIAAAPTIADKIKIMLKIRRGVVQNLSYLAVKLPDYCLKAYLRSLSGEDGDKLRLGDAVNLNTAQAKAGTKAHPTKTFVDLYAQKTDGYGKESDGPKPLNRKQRADFFGMYSNPLFELIRMIIEGEVQISLMEEDCQLLDLIATGEFSSDQFKIAVEAIQKRLDAANAA